MKSVPLSGYVGWKAGSGIVVLGTVLISVGGIFIISKPLIAGPLLAVGLLLEWVVFAHTYEEIKSVEEGLERRKREIDSAERDIKDIHRDIRNTQSEIERTKRDIFSDGLQSTGMGRDLESRIDKLEKEVGINSRGRNTLEGRISSVEDRLDKLDRGGNYL